MKFEPTHIIRLKDNIETGHVFKDGTPVRANTKLIVGNGKMVMVTDEDGTGQFVEYKELELLNTKNQTDENS